MVVITLVCSNKYVSTCESCQDVVEPAKNPSVYVSGCSFVRLVYCDSPDFRVMSHRFSFVVHTREEAISAFRVIIKITSLVGDLFV